MKKRLKDFSSYQKDRDLHKGKGWRILFMGTPEFACPSLERLILKEEVVEAVTQPDRPSGRGRKLAAPPIKRLAEKKGIPIYQPEKVNCPSFREKVRRLLPDLIVVVAFGQILSRNFLLIPRIFCINLHPSLLPHYRGPAPIPRAIINGERESGVTIQKMRERVDEGEIILQRRVPIALSDTAGSLEKELSHLGADLLEEAIGKIKQGSVEYRAQDEAQASYAPRINEEEGMIDWTQPSLKIHNLVRGLNPHPGAFTFICLRGEKKRMKIWQTELREEDFEEKARPGEIIRIEKGKGFLVRGGEGSLLIKEVQLPNRSRISGYDFIKGYQIKKGVILGVEA